MAFSEQDSSFVKHPLATQYCSVNKIDRLRQEGEGWEEGEERIEDLFRLET